MSLSISFGAMAPSLADQITSQGLFVIDENEMERLQMDVIALTRLSVRGIVSEAETERGRKRLMKRIVQNVRRISNEQPSLPTHVQ